MKTHHVGKRLTFGEFVTVVYEIFGSRRAKSIVRHAVNTHLVVFRGQQRFLVS